MTTGQQQAARHPIRWGPEQRRAGLIERLHTRLTAQPRHEPPVDREFEVTLGRLWRETCISLGLCERVTAAAGQTIRTPRFGGVRVGPWGTSFTVELLLGGAPEDITEHAPRLAPSLGYADLRVEPVTGRWVRVVLHDAPSPQH